MKITMTASKTVAADFELHTEFVGEVKKLTQKLARSLQIKGFRPVPGEPSAAYAGEFWKLSLSMDDTGKALSAVTGRLSMLTLHPKVRLPCCSTGNSRARLWRRPRTTW